MGQIPPKNRVFARWCLLQRKPIIRLGNERRYAMQRYQGNQKVRPGVYFNLQQIAFKSLDHEGPLPGTEEDEYVRVPTLALLIAGPIVGGIYVIFLPVIGFSMVLWHLAGKLVEVATEVAEASVRVLQPAWQPGLAFLSRGKRAKRGKRGRKKDKWAEAATKELEGGDDGTE
jgi:hypothetical protein